MTRLEARLERALARLVGEVMRGALVDPDRRPPARNAAVVEAEDLLAELDTPPVLYLRATPPVPPMRVS